MTSVVWDEAQGAWEVLGKTEAFLAFASPCPGPLPSLEPREGHTPLLVVCFADLACFTIGRLQPL